MKLSKSFSLQKHCSTQRSFAKGIGGRLLHVLSKPKASWTTTCSQRSTRLRLHQDADRNSKRFFSSQKLAQVEIESSLNEILKGGITHGENGGTPRFAPWEKMEDKDAIKKTFEFSNFSEAWGFMSRVALIAEKVSRKGYGVARKA